MLKQLQQEVHEWNDRNFGEQPSYMTLLGAMEELGELAHAHLKEEQGIRINEDHVAKAKDAIGDIIVYLAAYCCARKFDLESIVRDVWGEVYSRNWQKNKVNGKE